MAQTLPCASAASQFEGETLMRELLKSSMQLLAIVLVLITLALSTAAVSQWAEAGPTHSASRADSPGEQSIALTK